MKRIFSTLLVLTLLMGCSAQGQGLSESNSNNEAESLLQEELAAARKEVERLSKEYNELLEEKVQVVNTQTIKQEIEMELTILSKPEGTATLHPRLVLATTQDEDHNTPLSFVLDDQQLYEELEIGQTYNLKTYVIAVYDEQEDGIHHRFEFVILDFAS